jgi:hypothetical protein
LNERAMNAALSTKPVNKLLAVATAAPVGALSVNALAIFDEWVRRGTMVVGLVAGVFAALCWIHRWIHRHKNHSQD